MKKDETLRLRVPKEGKILIQKRQIKIVSLSLHLLEINYSMSMSKSSNKLRMETLIDYLIYERKTLRKPKKRKIK